MAFNVVETGIKDFDLNYAIIKSDLSTFKVYFESDKSGDKVFVKLRGCFVIVEQDIDLHIPNDVSDFLLESFEDAIKKELSK
jgi:hypothetical protein